EPISERNALRSLGSDLHPLGIFTNDAVVYDARGNRVGPQACLLTGSFNLKDWLYSLFYLARFIPLRDLANAMLLEQYELIDMIKVRNFEKLAKIQPALDFQKQNDIPVGKL